MNIFSKIILIAFVAATFCGSTCSAIVLDKDYLQSKISEDLNNQYAQKNPDGAVIVKNVPSIQVDLKGSTLAIETICDFNSIGKNKIAKVILSESGQVLRSFVVPVEVKSYDTVLVATKDILRGESLNASNTRYEKRSIEYNSGNVIGENFDYSHLSTQRTIKAGEILDKRFLTKQTAIYRTNPIIATFQSGGIQLSIEVIAMENGGIGDYIKVKSKEYNKIYQGKVISSNQVLIQI